MGQPLAPADMAKALAAIAAFRTAPEAPVPCPACGAAGLAVADCSARPHAEWYHLRCAACDLDYMLNIPMGAGAAGSWD